MKNIATYGPVFVALTHRSSDPSQPTLRVYPYKHHLNGMGEIVFELGKNDLLVEDFSNPIAKINWQNGKVKVLNQPVWDYLPPTIRNSINKDFYSFWETHHSS